MQGVLNIRNGILVLVLLASAPSLYAEEPSAYKPIATFPPGKAGEISCESVKDSTRCSGDLSCTYNLHKGTCHTRANLRKCESLPAYLCMRGDCTAPIPFKQCVVSHFHAKFDESPRDAIAENSKCASINRSTTCGRQFWCYWVSNEDGVTGRCTPRHTPIADARDLTRATTKNAASRLPTCPRGNCTYVTIGKNAHAFHVKWAGTRIALDPPLGDVRVALAARDEGALMELFPDGSRPANVTLERATGIKNAIAVIYKGRRYIIHDPDWTIDLSIEAGGLMTREIVLAHEFGHHICKHQETAGIDGIKQRELEADRVAGSILRNSRIVQKIEDTPGSSGSLEHILFVARQLFDQDASPSHPGRDDRLAAIAEGYRNGHKCHNR